MESLVECLHRIKNGNIDEFGNVLYMEDMRLFLKINHSMS